MQRPLGIVFVRHRRPESRHDRVAGELLYRAPCRLDLGGHRVVEPFEECPRPLRVLLAGELSRSDQVSKKDGRYLALFLGTQRVERRPAGKTEAGLRRILLAAPRTGRHAHSVRESRAWRKRGPIRADLSQSVANSEARSAMSRAWTMQLPPDAWDV